MTLIGFLPKPHEPCCTMIGYFYFVSHFLNIAFLTRTLVQGSSLSGTTIVPTYIEQDVQKLCAQTLRVLLLHSVKRMIGDGLYRSYEHIQVLIRQLCIKSYEKICISLRLLQSGCRMNLLNNKNGVAMKLVFICKGIKMKERTC